NRSREKNAQALSSHAYGYLQHLEIGIFAYGFARARSGDCGHDYFVAFSCKGRGVCPSCNTRRMVETAAHRTDHVFPRLPVRQWVLSVPKRLRFFMHRDGAVLGLVLRIFLRVIELTLQSHSPGAATADQSAHPARLCGPKSARRLRCPGDAGLPAQRTCFS
ncbi:MAG: hypothetical protein ACI83N_001858, partial [Hydrogenophaga sp.]